MKVHPLLAYRWVFVTALIYSAALFSNTSSACGRWRCCCSQPTFASPMVSPNSAPSSEVQIDPALVKGAFFVVFRLTQGGKIEFVSKHESINDAISAVQKLWRAGDNTAYFQRFVKPAPKRVT
jgi:hypothetical protein